MQRTDDPSDIVGRDARKQHQHPTLFVLPATVELHEEAVGLLAVQKVIVDPDGFVRVTSGRVRGHCESIRAVFGCGSFRP